MENSIEIPNYRVLIPNCTFGKKGEMVPHPLFEKYSPTTEIIQLTKYSIATKEEVIDLVQKSMRNFNPEVSNEEYSRKNRSIPFSMFIKELPPEEIKKIAEGDKKAMSHLDSHYSNGIYQPGKTYIQIMSGRIMDEVLDSLNEDILKRGDVAYAGIINSLGTNETYIRLRLDEKDALPDKLEIEYLLDRGVKDCDVFGMNGKFKEYQDFANQMRMIWNVLSSPEKIRMIRDDSKLSLETEAVDVIKGTARCFLEKKMMEGSVGGLAGVLDNILGSHSHKIEKRSRKRNDGHCSLN